MAVNDALGPDDQKRVAKLNSILAAAQADWRFELEGEGK